MQDQNPWPSPSQGFAQLPCPAASAAASEPYPPRHADELRITALLQTILKRLDAIEAKLNSLSKT